MLIQRQAHAVDRNRINGKYKYDEQARQVIEHLPRQRIQNRQGRQIKKEIQDVKRGQMGPEYGINRTQKRRVTDRTARKRLALRSAEPASLCDRCRINIDTVLLDQVLGLFSRVAPLEGRFVPAYSDPSQAQDRT